MECTIREVRRKWPGRRLEGKGRRWEIKREGI